MKLTIDFETRSECDLKACGHYVYAAHSSTQVQCLAIWVDDEVGAGSYVWAPDRVRALGIGTVGFMDDHALKLMILDADEIHAHNAGFERAIWEHQMVPLGFPPIPVDLWRCTAAKAAAMALPRSLGQAGSALGLARQKDEGGRKLMMAMCKPGRNGRYRESPEDYAALIRYCIQDVEAERALDAALLDLPEMERYVWRLDQIVNDRGFRVDVESIAAIIKKVEEHERALLLEVAALTQGRVTSPKQLEVSGDWLREQGVDLPDMTSETVALALDRTDLQPTTRRFLEIRQSLAKSSVSKYTAMLRMAGADGRVRGTTLYHGASTGRWSGKGVQPHNFPRAVIKEGKEALTESCLTALVHCDLDDVKKFGDPMNVASACLRSVIMADEGKHLLCADFANIEGRVAAWLAGEEWKLDAFRDLDAGTGACLYKLAYSRSFNIPVEQVSPDQRQIGKVQELALQYQGWVGAFESMAKNYGVRLPEEQVVEICKGWRNAHLRIVTYWGFLEDAAIRAVRTGKTYAVGMVTFGVRGRFLHMRLPSGRMLAYCDPRIAQVERHGQKKDQLQFWAVDSYTNKWQVCQTYGGCLFENAVQAIARDLLSEAMLRVELASFPVVLHVHDEVVSEVPADVRESALDEFCDLMRQLPDWAAGCPVEVKGWRGVRYRKD